MSSSPASLFAVDEHDECVRVTGLDKLTRSACVIVSGMRRKFADPCTLFFMRKRGYSLVVLLRIKQKLMNIDCRRLESHAAMT